MARIIYSFAGEGMGHAARYLAIAPHLKEMGHQVVAATGGDGLVAVPDALSIPVLRLEGRLEGKVSWPATVKQWMGSVSEATKCGLYYVMRQDCDLLVCDYEPLSAWLSVLAGIPRVSIDNQHFFSRVGLPSGTGWMSYIKGTAIGASAEFGVPLPKRTIIMRPMIDKKRSLGAYIVPPAIRRSIRGQKWKCGDRLLVYSDDPEMVSKVMEANVPADVFTACLKPGQIGEAAICQKNVKDFTKALLNCRGVISNAGTALAGEVMHIGAPLWVRALRYQPEQAANERLLGMNRVKTDNLTVEGIRNFWKWPYNHMPPYTADGSRAAALLIDEAANAILAKRS